MRDWAEGNEFTLRSADELTGELRHRELLGRLRGARDLQADRLFALDGALAVGGFWADAAVPVGAGALEGGLAAAAGSRSGAALAGGPGVVASAAVVAALRGAPGAQALADAFAARVEAPYAELAGLAKASEADHELAGRDKASRRSVTWLTRCTCPGDGRGGRRGGRRGREGAAWDG